MTFLRHRLSGKVKGVFSIPYEVRIPNGDASPYFGNYVSQKYGFYDTFTCWNFALCENAETQLELEAQLGRFTVGQMNWFMDNGFIDEDGDFYLSRRWGAILSGVKDNGNEQLKGWEIASSAGFIPFSMLPYSTEDAKDELTKDDFNNEYFNRQVITKEMEKMGIQFLKNVKIQFEEFGMRWRNKNPDDIMDALKQAPLQIGIPVPQDGSWNREFVKYDGRMTPDHSVELYKYVKGDPYPYYIYDSYEPHLKRLSANYYVPIATRVVLTARPPKDIPLYLKIWEAIAEWFDRQVSLARSLEAS